MAYTVCPSAQVITFNSPAPWITQRNDSIIVKAQLDTSKFSNKKITLAVSKVENGKKTVIKEKTFKVKDITHDFFLGLAGIGIVGGKDFLQIDWSVPKSTEKGSFAPVGIVKLSAIDKNESVHVMKTAEDIAAVSAVKDVHYTQLQDQQYGLLWNDKQLVVVVKKATVPGVIRFAFDGKNGKNAFLSYPDKIVDFVAEKDSLSAFDYQRTYQDSITYTAKSWKNDITKVTENDCVIITIPWSDLGLLPFEGRQLGFSVYSVGVNNSISAALPENAKMFIPGTWGTIVLDK
jgi:hypothetical protein